MCVCVTGLLVEGAGCAITSDPSHRGVVAEPVRVRRLTDRERQKLQQIVRRVAQARCATGAR